MRWFLNKFIRGAIVSLALALPTAAIAADTVKAVKRPIIVAVNQYMHHPNLEAVYDGFREVVDASAATRSWSVEYHRDVADKNVSTTAQIAQQHEAMRPDLVLALATPSAQASVKFVRSAPIVFGAITDPVGSKLVDSLDRPGGNVTGTSDRWPYDLQFSMMRKLVPNARVVGILYNPGESNSVASMAEIEPAAVRAGFVVEKAPVHNVGAITSAADTIAKDSDLLFAPADNTVLSGIAAIAKVARAKKKPLFVGDEGSVATGGVASYGINYRELGKRTGEIAVRIFEGTPAGTIPVLVSSGARVVANPAEAELQGLALPQDFLAGALTVGGSHSARP